MDKPALTDADLAAHIAAGAPYVCSKNHPLGDVAWEGTFRRGTCECGRVLAWSGKRPNADPASPNTVERLRSIRVNTDAWPKLLTSQQWAIIDAIRTLSEIGSGNQPTQEHATAMGKSAAPENESRPPETK